MQTDSTHNLKLARQRLPIVLSCVLAVTLAGTSGCRSRAPAPQTAEEPKVEHFLDGGDAEDASSRKAVGSAPHIDVYVSTSGSDAADGSAAHPWRTVERAAAMVRPGTTVHVTSGEYELHDTELKTSASGTPTDRIRYVSDKKWGARLSSTKTGNSAVWWNVGDYVDIEGFDISGRGALGIYNEGSHTRIIGNHVHDIPAPGCPENGGAGIHDGNFHASDDDVIGNWVHDIGDYNALCPRVHGIYHTNRGGRISKNITFHNQGFGIHLWHGATDVTISDNTVFGNAYGGIFIGAVSSEIPGGGVADNMLVANNIIYRNGLVSGARGNGIQEDGDVGKGNRYVNNLVYENMPAETKLLTGRESGTLHVDPQFVDYRPNGKGNYGLRSTSPACSSRWRHVACDTKVAGLVLAE